MYRYNLRGNTNTLTNRYSFESGKKGVWLVLYLFLLADVYGQTGRVGINTTSPAAMLHVKDSSVLLEAPAVLPAMPGLPPVSGPGIRMMWYSPKGALRVGRVTGSQWDRDSIGVYSFAAGQNTKAKGAQSMALGNGANATGTSAVAIGSNANATGGGSVAMGTNTIASGNVAMALGSGTQASGSSSTAMGSNSMASGNISTAIGASTKASGNNSVAMGASTTASGVSSTAMGNGTFALGTASTAAGFNTKASGSNSTAMGLVTQANGFSSLVIGQYNDTLIAAESSISATTPLFILGNGDPGMPSNALVVRKDGRVGIGVNAPAATLDVNGQLKISGGAPGNGKVLTSDASGLATWQTPSTGADNLGNHQATQNIRTNGHWISNDGGNEGLFVDVNGRVGIGANLPSAHLYMRDKNALFELFQLPNTPAETPMQYGGMGFMWYSDKVALRAGRADPFDWSKDSIGLFSVILGGEWNLGKGESSFIGGGTSNQTNALKSFVGGGQENKTSGDYSFVGGGFGNKTTGIFGFVGGGFTNTASGPSSFIAGGSNHIASGNSSFIGGGDGNTSSGSYSFSSGTNNTVSSQRGFIGGGFNNLVSGINGFVAGGNNNIVSGNLGFTAGGGMFARSLGEIVVGLNGTDYTPIEPDGFHNEDRLFVIGNGPTNLFRRNALTMLKNGKVGIDTENPQVKLHITGGSDANESSTTSGYFVIGQTNGINIVMDNNEIMARNNGTTSPLYLQNDGGNISIGGAAANYQLTLSANSAAKPTSNTWTIPSDARLKKDIRDYEDGLDEVMRIHTVQYTYTGEAGLPKDTGIGVLAQELQEVAPYMVGTWNHERENGETTEYLSVDNGAMTYMLINAVKEQQAMIKQLIDANARLQERLEALEAKK